MMSTAEVARRTGATYRQARHYHDRWVKGEWTERELLRFAVLNRVMRFFDSNYHRGSVASDWVMRELIIGTDLETTDELTVTSDGIELVVDVESVRSFLRKAAA